MEDFGNYLGINLGAQDWGNGDRAQEASENFLVGACSARIASLQCDGRNVLRTVVQKLCRIARLGRWVDLEGFDGGPALDFFPPRALSCCLLVRSWPRCLDQAFGLGSRYKMRLVMHAGCSFGYLAAIMCLPPFPFSSSSSFNLCLLSSTVSRRQADTKPWWLHASPGRHNDNHRRCNAMSCHATPCHAIPYWSYGLP